MLNCGCRVDLWFTIHRYFTRMFDDLLVSLTNQLIVTLFAPGSLLSVWSLLAAGLIAAGLLVAKRASRPLPPRVLARALFPKRWLWSASARADIAFTVFAVFASGAMLGWAIVSHVSISSWVAAALGAPLSLGLPSWLAVTLMTVVLWVSYEFVYWWNHYLAHKWAWLWAFHKVHHSAETLSPLTIFRVHPVDSIVFYNMIAVVTGIASGAMHWLVGAGISPWTIGGANILSIIALLTIKHLHHSHVWIAWNGPLSRILLSPAHHQIHHSSAVEHHDRNFGDMLGVFDWLAGTMHQPQPKREALIFGVEGVKDPHGVTGALIEPFADAADKLRPAAAPTLSPQ